MRWRVLVSCTIILACGCGRGSYQFVPVAGRVTLNSKPLAKAHVYFQPIGANVQDAPGPGSIGQTDADGRYTLRVDDKRSGAVVGKHRVMISTLGDDNPQQPDATTGGKTPRDKVPRRYNSATELTVEVPPEGLASADFDLKAP